MNAKHWLSVAMLHVTLPHVSMQDAGPKGECQSSRMYQNGLQTPGSKGGVYFADYLKSPGELLSSSPLCLSIGH